MDSHTVVFKYLVGTGLFTVCLLAAVIIAIIQHRQQRWARSITMHMVQVTLSLCAVGIASHYAYLAIEDYHLTWLTPRMVNVATVFIIACILMQKFSLLINRLVKVQVKKGRDATSTLMIARVMKFGGFLCILILFGEHFGLSISGLLAFGGIGGIAIAMASKDILSNLFSGAMLYFDRQFNIGDWISSPDRNIEGTVVEIGWRLTQIMTFDNRPLYVPNSVFSSISVENPGRMTNRRISTEIGLRYEDADKIKIIVENISQMLAQHPDIDQSQTTLVYFNAFADSSLNIMVYCFTKTTKWAEWLNVQQNVYLKIIDIVQQQGADFAFPSQTVYVEKNS